MSPIPLANRLSVHVLNDLNANCPKTILAINNWIDQVTFWLADLSTHPRTSDQTAFMLYLLSMNLAATMGCSLQDARQLLKDELIIHQFERVLS